MKLSLLILFILWSDLVFSPAVIENYRIYDTRAKKTCTIEEMISALAKADAVFFGEEHNDPTGHQLELEIFKMLHQKNGKEQVLSMEMFETDVQLVLNEYLQNQIREKNFIKEARAWNNYNDYKPMIEYAREQQLPVLAANTPNRYVNLVTRKSLAGLNNLGKDSRKWLPPLPADTASGRYYENFLKAMGGHSVPGMEIYQSQNLWDTGMAWSIFSYMKKNKRKNVFHVLGRFHSDEKLGTAARLIRYKPGSAIANISCFSDASFKQPDWGKFSHLADYVIITNPDIKRTF